MKQLLIVRVPISFPPDQVGPLNDRISARLNANYDVIVTVEAGIERIEFDIVFNPHSQFIGGEGHRQFNQVDTSAGSYMEGRGTFERVNSSDKR